MPRRAYIRLAAALALPLALAACTRRAVSIVVDSSAPPSQSAVAQPTPDRMPATSSIGLPSVALPSRSTAPSFAEFVAVDCRGWPRSDQILGVLRAENLLAAGAAVTVTSGPLCAGGWQYTVLTQSGRDPLQVVTQGPPSALRLVTAGTDVCTPEVRVLAPVGIRAVANCPAA